jgi:hypothetical protein
MAFCHRRHCEHCGERREFFDLIWRGLTPIARIRRVLGILQRTDPVADSILNTLIREDCPARVQA